MVTVRITVTGLDELDTVTVQAVAEFSPAMKAEFDAKARARLDAERERLVNENPPPSPLPYTWSANPIANARAQRWYFANKVPKGSRGKGQRYRRTGKLREAWESEFVTSTTTTEATLRNPAEGASHVYEFQNPSHAATGWSQIDEEADALATGFAHDLDEVFR